MPNLQLTWNQAAVLAAALLVLGLVLARAGSARDRQVAPFVREAGVIGLLYALWQLAGTLATGGTAGAVSRARWIERTERSWHLPSELSLQRPLLEHATLARAANVYYATMHFTGLFVLLFWLFLRHRDHYPPVRAVVVGFTLVSLLVQLIPVAPPRLLTSSGFTDVAARYGQSVYGLGAFTADQLSALPSVHVGWALIVGIVPVCYGRGRWRWLAPAHPVLTVYVVVATANHWWFDGLAAAAILLLVVAAVAAGAAASPGIRRRWAWTPPARPGAGFDTLGTVSVDTNR